MTAAEDLCAGWRLPPDCIPLGIDERIRRDFRAELGSFPGGNLAWIFGNARVTAKPPGWVADREADAWLILGNGTACPLLWQDGELVATEVLTRSAIRRGAPERRRARRRAR